MNYIEVDGKPVKCDDTREWARYFESGDRQVDATRIDDVRISTVFLGINHNWGVGPPLLYETMVFGGPLDEDMERYHTREEAQRGHDRFVKAVLKDKGLTEMPKLPTKSKGDSALDRYYNAVLEDKKA